MVITSLPFSVKWYIIYFFNLKDGVLDQVSSDDKISDYVNRKNHNFKTRRFLTGFVYINVITCVQ